MAAEYSTPALSELRSDLSGNSAGTDGGGLYNGGTANLVYSTVDDNTAFAGGGMYADPLGQPVVLIGTEVNAQQGRQHLRPGDPALSLAMAVGPRRLGAAGHLDLALTELERHDWYFPISQRAQGARFSLCMVEQTTFHRGGNMADWDPAVNEIFTRAVEAGSPTERAAVLDQSCGDDAELRRKVEALLYRPRRCGSFLEHPAPGLGSARSVAGGKGATLASPEPGRSSVRIDEKTEPFDPSSSSSDNPVSRPLTEGPGTRIGPYKLLQQIGEGGMGVVYMAEQE